MLIDNMSEYDAVWDKVYTKLKFNPSCKYRGHKMTGSLPFTIDVPYFVYAIEDMTEKQLDLMEELVKNCLIACATPEKEWYALD